MDYVEFRAERRWSCCEQSDGIQLPPAAAAGIDFCWCFTTTSEEIMKQPTHAEATAIQVLLVEDSPGDVRLTQEAFREANGAIQLHVAADGVEAMAFLRHSGVHARSPRPDLILLDLNLPRMDGREVLAHIKEDADLKTIPTVILTTSDAEIDIVKSYQLQANCYLSKPVQLEAFEKLVKSINEFWLTAVKLPPQKLRA
jgi:chemotaxis family two-component system response regulator Rcp1